MKANLGIKDNNLQEVVDELSKLLADEFVLYTKTRNAHWNVIGLDFYGKHNLFEDHYNDLATIIDDVAERIRTLGHYAPATLDAYLKLTRLTEQSRNSNNSKGFISDLVNDHESIIFRLREQQDIMATKHKDYATADFMVSLLSQHEKMAWMLRAHLNEH